MENRPLKRNLTFLLLALIVLSVFYALYDISRQTDSPMERKKKRESAEKPEEKALPALQIFADSLPCSLPVPDNLPASDFARKLGLDAASDLRFSADKKTIIFRIRAKYLPPTSANWESIARKFNVPADRLRQMNEAAGRSLSDSLLIPIP